MNEEIKNGILFLLSNINENSPCNGGYTLLEIKGFLELNNKEIEHKDLKLILGEMEDNDLIEERHFDKEFSGRVDYSNENAGSKIVEDNLEELNGVWDLE